MARLLLTVVFSTFIIHYSESKIQPSHHCKVFIVAAAAAAAAAAATWQAADAAVDAIASWRHH